MKKKLVFWIAGVVVLGLIVAGILAKVKAKHPVKAASARGSLAINVQTQAAVLGDLSSVNSLSGNVSGNQTATVGTQVNGRVEAICADVGQAVSAGEVLARLDPTQLKDQLAQYKAEAEGDQAALAQAKVDYQRDQQLYISGAVAKATLDQSRLTLATDQSKFDAAQAQVASLQTQVQETAITSPVAGVVATKTVQIGEEVSSQSTLFTVVQIDPVQVTVDVPDSLIAAVHPGTAARITVPEVSGKVFSGTVAHVSPVLDTGSHGYPVQILVKNPKSSMLPGMTATVVFTGLHQKSGVVIPVQAVLETPQGSEVFTVSNGIAHLHVIQLGAVSSNKAVVESGLLAGDQVVINGESLLSDGSHVNVVANSAQAGVQGMTKQIEQGAGK